MSDYGIAVSQRGNDVENCGDRNLVYNSAFQTLKVFNRYSVSTTIPASGTNTIEINHNLGYYAPFIVIYNSTSNDKAYFMSGINGFSIHQFIKQYENKLEINVENLYASRWGSVGATAYFTVYVFLDDFRAIEERTIKATLLDPAAGSSDFGMRISKEGYDVTECTADELIMSSSFFTNIVHKKGIDTTGELVTVTHDLDYVPSALVYGRASGDTYIRMCEGMPFYLNPFFGGRTGWFYAADDSDLKMGENYFNGVDGSWRANTTFYYVIFKSKVNG